MWQNPQHPSDTPHDLSLNSKLPNVGTTIFTVMSKLAADEGAINLSQGYPDFDGPPLLLERVGHYLTNGYNQYPPMAGIEPLREAIANKVGTLYGAEIDAESEVTVTSGATEALFCAVTAVIQPGDEAIVFDPCYDSYEPAVTLAGGVCRHIPLQAPVFPHRLEPGCRRDRAKDAADHDQHAAQSNRRRLGRRRHRQSAHRDGWT